MYCVNKWNGKQIIIMGRGKWNGMVQHSCAVLFQPKFDMVLEKMNVLLSVIVQTT